MDINDFILSRIINGQQYIFNHLLIKYGNSKKILNTQIPEIKELLLTKNLPYEFIFNFLKKKEEFDKNRNLFIGKCFEDLGEINSIFKKNKIKIVTISEKEYPFQLREINDPPICLFIKGKTDFEFEKSIAIIGTRSVTGYGEEKTREMSNDLSKKGYNIISGLARGVDTSAHRAAISAGGRTTAVLHQGLIRVYPTENEQLSEEIVENNGSLVTEIYPKEIKMEKGKFIKNGNNGLYVQSSLVRRNRIISGLSKAVLIIEGSLKSGSFSQYNHAKKQKREIFTLIPNKDHIGSFLPKKIIELGGLGITKSEEIIGKMESNKIRQIGSFL